MNGLTVFKLIVILSVIVWGYDVYTEGFTSDSIVSLVMLSILWIMYSIVKAVVRRGYHA